MSGSAARPSVPSRSTISWQRRVLHRLRHQIAQPADHRQHLERVHDALRASAASSARRSPSRDRRASSRRARGTCARSSRRRCWRPGMSKPVGLSNSSAGPPPADLHARSVTAAISRSGLTGSAMRASRLRARRDRRGSRSSLNTCVAYVGTRPFLSVIFAASRDARGARRPASSPRRHRRALRDATASTKSASSRLQRLLARRIGDARRPLDTTASIRRPPSRLQRSTFCAA